MLRAGFSARSTALWERSLTRWLTHRLKILQRRENRLLQRLERNRRRQVRNLQHPLHQRHLHQQAKILQARALQPGESPPPPFDLRHLL